MEPAALMVVSDLPVTAAQLVRSLERCRYSTMVAVSAPAALELTGERALDLVLVEASLGEMGGLQLCREIGRQRPDLPVVVVSASAELVTARAARAAHAAGAYDLLALPLDDGELCYRVECALHRRQLEQSIRRMRELSAAWVCPAEPATAG